MTEIITALRSMAGGTGSTGADLVTLGQNHIREILAHIDAQDRVLRTVERWANHHARKPNTTAEEALGVIQHHPAIRAITASYADGVVPDAPDPYAEIERLRAALTDMLAGWRYIRQSHGDLYGVGWDRAQGRAEAALGLQPGQEMPAEWFGA